MNVASAFRDSLLKLLDASKMSAHYPYVAEFRVKYDLNTKDLDQREFRGLLFVQLLVKDSNSPARLISYWLDKEAFDQNKTAFGQAVLKPATPSDNKVEWEGRYENTLVDAIPRGWKRVVPWLSGLWFSLSWTLAFIVGVFAHGIWLNETTRKFKEAFATPDFELVSVERTKKVLVDRDLDLQIEVRNLSPYVKADITVDEVILENEMRNQAGIHLDPIVGGRFSSLEPSKKESFRITGFAEKSGKYIIKLTATAKAGELKETQVPKTFTFPVEVWSDFEAGKRRIVRSDEKTCTIRLELLAGKRFEKGVRITAKLEREPEILFEDPGPGLRVTRVMDAGEEVTRRIWRSAIPVGPVERFSEAINLRSTKSISRDRWEDVAKKMIITYHDLNEGE